MLFCNRRTPFDRMREILDFPLSAVWGLGGGPFGFATRGQVIFGCCCCCSHDLVMLHCILPVAFPECGRLGRRKNFYDGKIQTNKYISILGTTVYREYKKSKICCVFFVSENKNGNRQYCAKKRARFFARHIVLHVDFIRAKQQVIIQYNSTYTKKTQILRTRT